MILKQETSNEKKGKVIFKASSINFFSECGDIVAFKH